MNNVDNGEANTNSNIKCNNDLTQEPPYLANETNPNIQQKQHQQHQHQPNQYLTGGISHPAAPDNSGMVAAAVTFGSVLGLSAAAAVRWLNGGDFTLFPPAVTDNNSTTPSAEMDSIGRNIHIDNAASIAAAEAMIARDHQMEQAMETIREQRQQQGDLLHRLDNIVQRQAEQQQQHPDSLESVFLGLKMELAMLRVDFKNSRSNDSSSVSTVKGENLENSDDDKNNVLENQLKSMLQRLEVALDKVTPRPSGFDEKSSSPFDSTPPRSNNQQQSGTLSRGNNEPTGTCDNNLLKKNDDSNHRRVLADAISTLVDTVIAPQETQEASDTTNGLNTVGTRQRGLQLLYMYTNNLVQNLSMPRYRKIYTANASFQSVASMKGAQELLLAVGFVACVDGASTFLEWLPKASTVNNDDVNVAGVEDTTQHHNESMYLCRLKEATLALESLKSLLSEQQSVGDMTSPSQILSQVLDAAGLAEDDVGSSSVSKTCPKVVMEMGSGPANASVPQTPEKSVMTTSSCVDNVSSNSTATSSELFTATNSPIKNNSTSMLDASMKIREDNGHDDEETSSSCSKEHDTESTSLQKEKDSMETNEKKCLLDNEGKCSDEITTAAIWK